MKSFTLPDGYDYSDVKIILTLNNQPNVTALFDGVCLIKGEVFAPPVITPEMQNVINYFGSDPTEAPTAAENPIVTGVVDGKTYLTSRTITFDDGTGACTATLASIITTGSTAGTYSTAASFINGATISADGKYKLDVTGSTGSHTIVEFCLYSHNYVKGISVTLPTYVSDLIANISVEEGQTVVIKQADGTTDAGSTDLVATGMVVKVMSGATEISSQTIVVYGDMNGDGAIQLIDMALLKKQALKLSILTGAMQEASDLNRDGHYANISDLLKLKKFILSLGDYSQY